MLRRLHPEQPDTFAFTPANAEWADAQISKYPTGREASAIIPLLWRAQEQEGWLTRPAIEHVAERLNMAYIRALEVASFYFMFQLQPVGSLAHIQICGTTSCMICGAEDLVDVCKKKIAAKPHALSEDGRFSWEEVECLGACANAPMAQIGKDYYEDLTPERLEGILDRIGAGEVPTPGPQNGRFTSEPLSGLTSLSDGDKTEKSNGSVTLATDIGDTIKRIDGTEVPLRAPWRDGASETPTKPAEPKPAIKSDAVSKAKPKPKPAPAPEGAEGTQPVAMQAARDGGADDLKKIKGIGPKLEAMLNDHGIYHFDQIAAWSAEEVAWVDTALVGFKGRATRDDWVAQAKILAEGGETEFSQRAKY